MNRKNPDELRLSDYSQYRDSFPGMRELDCSSQTRQGCIRIRLVLVFCLRQGDGKPLRRDITNQKSASQVQPPADDMPLADDMPVSDYMPPADDMPVSDDMPPTDDMPPADDMPAGDDRLETGKAVLPKQIHHRLVCFYERDAVTPLLLVLILRRMISREHRDLTHDLPFHVMVHPIPHAQSLRCLGFH